MSKEKAPEVPAAAPTDTNVPPPSKKVLKVYKGFPNAAVDHSRLVGNDDAYPDVFFSWEGDSSLSAHHSVLKARVPFLLTDIKQNKKKKNTWLVDISKYLKPTPSSTQALTIVLQYIYSGEVDLETYSITIAIEVLAIAKAFKMEHLLQVNIKYIQEQINDTNIFDTLKYAHRLEVEEIKALSIDYALKNPDFFTSKKAKEVGFELFQEAIASMVQHWTNKTEPKGFEKRVSATNSVSEDFARLYAAKGDSGDVTFKISDKNIKCHKAILSSISSELDQLLESNPQTITLDPKYARVSDRAFEALLQFLYHNSIDNMKMLYVCQLHQFAVDYKLTRVVQMLEKQMDVLPCDNKSAVFALEVAYIELEHDKRLRKLLRKKGINQIVENMDKINFSHVEAMPAVIGADIVLSIQKAVQSNWEAVGAGIKEGVRSVPIATNFPGGSKKNSDNSDKSEAGDPSEKSEGGMKRTKSKSGKTAKVSAEKKEKGKKE